MNVKSAAFNKRLGPNGPQRSYRTQCKLGKHAIYDGDPTVWLTTTPIGLSCQACVDKQQEVTP